jgi:sec-independent protein translocase protein TatB
MEILGIGASELVFVVIIALIVLGPKDMQKAGRTIGKWMRDIVTSDGWKVFQKTSNELRKLPTQMMRDANEEINKFNRDIKAGMDINIDKDKPKPKSPPRSVSTPDAPLVSTPDSNLTPSDEQENTILPPAPKSQPDESADPQKHD